ncbi:MAG: hypothetical protein H6829_13220 [Planctomycetes bacterium]|nr:hypothetical protein [Planctomycetota bacterium]MCB9911965.1 hypothetical protein [Planctomycetota bacterium]HPF13263.1 hypothetical protein [Planctomycetota bacterium]
MKPGYKMRTRKLIDKSLQLRLVGAFVAVGCVATLFQVVLLNQSMLGFAEKLPQGGDQLLAEAPGLLVKSVLVTLGLLVPVMTLVGILITHRIAGPAYRMRMHLEAIETTGEIPGPCKIRKGDELQELCSLLNQAIEVVAQGTHTVEPAQTVAENRKALDSAPSLNPSSPAEAVQKNAK